MLFCLRCVRSAVAGLSAAVTWSPEAGGAPQATGSPRSPPSASRRRGPRAEAAWGRGWSPSRGPWQDARFPKPGVRAASPPACVSSLGQGRSSGRHVATARGGQGRGLQESDLCDPTQRRGSGLGAPRGQSPGRAGPLRLCRRVGGAEVGCSLRRGAPGTAPGSPPPQPGAARALLPTGWPGSPTAPLCLVRGGAGRRTHFCCSKARCRSRTSGLPTSRWAQRRCRPGRARRRKAGKPRFPPVLAGSRLLCGVELARSSASATRVGAAGPAACAILALLFLSQSVGYRPSVAFENSLLDSR